MTAPLEPALTRRLRDRFTEHVMTEARLPDARRADVAESIELRLESGQLFCTCDITGSTKERDWDGSPVDAEALVDDLADETAFLVSKTPHYAWLRTSR